MNEDIGRKEQVQVMFTQKLLREIDTIAEREREAEGNREPNRSAVIRRLVRKGLDAEGAGR